MLIVRTKERSRRSIYTYSTGSATDAACYLAEEHSHHEAQNAAN